MGGVSRGAEESSIKTLTPSLQTEKQMRKRKKCKSVYVYSDFSRQSNIPLDYLYKIEQCRKARIHLDRMAWPRPLSPGSLSSVATPLCGLLPQLQKVTKPQGMWFVSEDL